MPTTPIYGWPYQSRGAAPGLTPEAIEAMALKMEATITALEARLAAAEAIAATVPYRDSIVTVGAVGSVIFSGIPSTLRVVRISTTTRGSAASAATELMLRINGDTGNNYRHNSIFSQNGGAPTNGSSLAVAFARVNVIPGASATAGVFAGGDLCIEGWNSPHASHLNITCHGGYVDTAGNQIIYQGDGVYLGAGPYTSITLLPVSGNFVAGCGFHLEGLR